MDLVRLTRQRYVWPGLDAPRKEDAIERLLDLLLEAGALPSDARAEVLDAVMAREQRLSTGLEHGIAIPHGQTSRVETEVAAVGVFPRGVHFGGLDDQATRIVILLITPDRKRHRHVTNLAAIARQLLCADVREAIVRARTADEALSALAGAGP